MEITDLIRKFKEDSLTEDELGEFSNVLVNSLGLLKEESPEEYLAVLKKLTRAFEELAAELSGPAS